MSVTVAELMATLGLDTSSFDKSLGQAQKNTQGFSSTMSGLAAVGGGILTAGITAAAGAATLLGVELSKDIQIAADSQKVQAQLNAVLKSTHGIAGITADKANELANSLSKVTAFDDEAITSGESMLLTFTNIGKNIFPSATQTILDMSSALGQDLQSSAIQLGKALNDPIQGVTALQRVGVSFTDSQKKMIESLVKAGHTEEAQRLILKELQTEFGGSAVAAGKTFAGQMTILKNTIDNVRENVGGKFLPILGQLGKMFSDELNKPETLAFIDQLSTTIANFAQQAVNYIPIIIQNFQMFSTWLTNNKPIVIGVLAALGSAVLAFAYSVAAAAIAAITPLLPVIAVMLLIGAVAYLVYRAWTENWGGIQQKTQAAWNFIQPIVMSIYNWLKTNIPIALQALANFWTSVLWPAIQKVWSWMSSTLFPFLRALASFFAVNFVNGVRVLAGVFSTVLWPAISGVFNWMAANVLPILRPIVQFLAVNFVKGLYAISEGIRVVTSWLRTMTAYLSNIHLPDWMTPGSPTPLEIGLLGIADALQKVNGISFQPQMALATIPTANNNNVPAVTADNVAQAGQANTPSLVIQNVNLNSQPDIDYFLQQLEERLIRK